MDIIFLIIGILLHFFATPILIIALIWFFFVARRLYREKKSLDAFQGNESAQAMTKDRLKASLIKSLGIVLFPVTLLAMALVLASTGLGEAGASLAFGVAVGVSVAFFIWAARIKRRYNTSFKENFVKGELTKVFDKLEFKPDQKFDQKPLQDLGFFTFFDDYGGNDLIAAEYQGLAFAQCDMRVKERYTVTVQDKDGDSHTEERWRDVFRGRAMRFDFADPFRGKVQVVSKDFEGAAVKSQDGWQRVETELAEFGQYFEVYALDPLDAMAALTPQMIEGIFYLKKALDVPTALYFTGKAMTVFLALTRNAFDVSGGKTLLEESRLLERDIALMTGFMDVMYFKRQVPIGEGGEDGQAAEGERGEKNRAEIAAAVAAAAGPSVAAKAARQVGRGVGAVWAFLPKIVIAVYVISAIYGFINLPGEIAGGFTLGDEVTASSDAQQIPTIGFIVVAGFFIVIPALKRSFIFSAICLALYLLFMSANL